MDKKTNKLSGRFKERFFRIRLATMSVVFACLLIIQAVAFSLGPGTGKVLAVSQNETTSAEAAADRSADDFCGPNNGTSNITNCKKFYKAGYLGNPLPDGEGSCTDTGFSCRTVYQKGTDGRRTDFKEIPNGVCTAYIEAAQDSNSVPQSLRNLNNNERNQAIDACNKGFRWGLGEADSCNSQLGGNPGQMKRDACSAGEELANLHVFIPGEATAHAKGQGADSAPGNGGSIDAAGDSQKSCEDEGGVLGWIICPLIDLATSFSDFAFQQIIAPMLEKIPISADRHDPGYKSWQGFRFLANIMLIGTLLAIVYSQARGGKE